MSPPGLIEDASGFSDEGTVDDSSGSEASSGSGEASLGSGGSIGTDESSSGDPTDLSSGERITSSLMTEGEVGSLVLILVAVAIGFLLVVLTVAAVYRYCAPPTPESKPDVDEGQVTWLSGAARRDPGLEGGCVAVQVAPGGETAGVDTDEITIAVHAADTETVEWTFGPGPLGLGLSDAAGGGVFISQVTAGSAAAELGIDVGVKVLSLNGLDVTGHDKESLSQMIAEAPRPLIMTLSMSPMDSKTHTAFKTYTSFKGTEVGHVCDSSSLPEAPPASDDEYYSEDESDEMQSLSEEDPMLNPDYRPSPDAEELIQPALEHLHAKGGNATRANLLQMIQEAAETAERVKSPQWNRMRELLPSLGQGDSPSASSVKLTTSSPANYVRSDPAPQLSHRGSSSSDSTSAASKAWGTTLAAAAIRLEPTTDTPTLPPDFGFDVGAAELDIPDDGSRDGLEHERLEPSLASVLEPGVENGALAAQHAAASLVTRRWHELLVRRRVLSAWTGLSSVEIAAHPKKAALEHQGEASDSQVAAPPAPAPAPLAEVSSTSAVPEATDASRSERMRALRERARASFMFAAAIEAATRQAATPVGEGEPSPAPMANWQRAKHHVMWL